MIKKSGSGTRLKTIKSIHKSSKKVSKTFLCDLHITYSIRNELKHSFTYSSIHTRTYSNTPHTYFNCLPLDINFTPHYQKDSLWTWSQWSSQANELTHTVSIKTPTIQQHGNGEIKKYIHKYINISSSWPES